MFSYVQELIIGKLITSEGLRYSKLRPEAVDDDLYNYHLQELVKKGYVEKNEASLYILSAKGKEHVQSYDARGLQKDYFKFTVIGHTIDKEGNILLQKRLRHPYFGDIYGGISGKVLLGEKVEDAAKRKVQEETGLICDQKFLGVLRKTRRDKSGHIFEDTLYHICVGYEYTGKLIEENEFGKNYWGTFEEAIKAQKKNVTAGPYSGQILDRLRESNEELFYFHEEIILKDI